MSTKLGALLIVFSLWAMPTAAEDAASAWEVHPVLVGTTIPDISFIDEDGKPFSIRERAKEKPLILVIYRGLW